MHEAPFASPFPQVLVSEKEVRLAPAKAMPPMRSESVPELVSVTVWVEESVVPSTVGPKRSKVGESVINGEAAVLNVSTKLDTLMDPRPEAGS